MKDSRNSHLILGEGNGNIFMMFTFTQSEYSQRDFINRRLFSLSMYFCTVVVLEFKFSTSDVRRNLNSPFTFCEIVNRIAGKQNNLTDTWVGNITSDYDKLNNGNLPLMKV